MRGRLNFLKRFSERRGYFGSGPARAEYGGSSEGCKSRIDKYSAD
jgi:hypothetical protein